MHCQNWGRTLEHQQHDSFSLGWTFAFAGVPPLSKTHRLPLLYVRAVANAAMAVFSTKIHLSMTLQVDILNPKATKLLQNLADLNLISIKETQEDGFLKIIKKLRAKASSNPPTLEEITKEVELVRAKKYAKEKK